MADEATRRGERRRRRATIAALLVSLCAHGVLLAALAASLLLAEKEKTEEPELVFLEPPPPPPEPMVVAPPAPAPEPTARRPKARPKAAAPSARPTPSASEMPLGSPDAPVSDAPVATSPTPSSGDQSTSRPISPDQIRTGLTWSAFEKTFEATASAARAEYAAQSMEKRRGSFRFGALTGKVKAAMENHSSWVAQAPQDQLSPTEVRSFRTYLERTHDKIHELFADGFLASLSSLDPSDPLNNMALVTLMEFEILASGKINEVHVLKTSGNAVFDAAAVHALYGASPFLPPPADTLSWNNRVYFRWGFHRNQRKCGTFNAEPYRLRAPNAAPEAIPDDSQAITDG
jgi:TonB family protein